MAAPETTKFQVNYKLADGTTVHNPAPAVNKLDDRVNPPATAPATSLGSTVCRHGVMTLREGVGAKGPWKGYMCAAPKGATDKCQTIWVR